MAMSFQMLVPKIDTTSRIRKNVGNTMKASVARINRLSSRPLKYPAGPPMGSLDHGDQRDPMPTTGIP